MAQSGIEFDEGQVAAIRARMQSAPRLTSLAMHGLADESAQKMVDEARHQIDALVYSAPLSTSGYARTGDTRRAIEVKGTTMTSGGAARSTVWVNPGIANRKRFFYPRVLNRGRPGTTYYPRPFWTNTVALMRVRYLAGGMKVLKELKRNFGHGPG
jgi:hypothetical protein